MRGILLSDPSDTLVIRPTDGDVAAFGRAGDSVDIARTALRRRGHHWAVRQDAYPINRAPERSVATNAAGLLAWSVEPVQIEFVETRNVAEAARMLRHRDMVYNRAGQPIGWLRNMTYYTNESYGGTLREWHGHVTRYRIDVVGPWEWER